MVNEITFEEIAEQWGKAYPKIVNMIYELDTYQKIGSVSTCAAAVANYTPATMIFPKGGYAICPICDHGVRVTDKYCNNCGKRLVKRQEKKNGECEDCAEKLFNLKRREENGNKK